ncbi:malectin/receptor-like protein kinase family protein [Actinidia rufa]|uniref:Malectin/receptor-like protein kinase family protein n=1 Tax=Actinidia rufa TaxID=165716 RepID=A0A7J0ELV5_9ERIC|nr:malectin/receptor-like protein kinase family protein [Actinidia rufa]
MSLCPLSIIISLLFFLYHLILTASGSSPNSYYPLDDIAVNCGSTGNTISLDGREWIGDIGSRFTSTRRSNGKPISSKESFRSVFADPVPYMTARISYSPFSYAFPVSPGQIFIRLHFYPALYPGFERAKGFFGVKAGAYTLLSNFSASLTSETSGLKSFAKEFCMNVEENQVLSITFTPESSASNSVYAFVNGIEIISMPTGLYYTPDGDFGALVVGQKHQFHIDNSTALELVQRLNVGGRSILPVEDWGMFRQWSGDSDYLLELGVLPVTTSISIKYTNIPTYTAPQKVYQSAWSMDPSKQTNKMCNLTWIFPVDLGFRYLIRLHFCELDYGVKESGQREFSIFINNKTAEEHADLIKWSGGNGVAMYRDYLVMIEGNRMEGKRDLIIALQPQYYESMAKYHTGAVLNGLEVFKLSNPDNNLAGQNPKPLAHIPIATTPKLLKVLLGFGNGNMIVSGLIVLITLLNIIVYKLRVWTENGGEKEASVSLRSEEECRRFSLFEIQMATNNFDDELVIGDGGFGKVYKGLIDKGATLVAVKRLKSMSKQGAQEFWTEIKMLSNLRHTHLVTLIGYCNENQEMILVYEYMVHGTLADHLHKISRDGIGSISPLSWEQRLNICIGAARGLEHLHTGAQHRVIHRDVKTSNILLDENWVVKISDFGLSKLGGNDSNQSSTYVITEVKGTFGYLDVEYFLTHRLTRKSDVYAFGVVLFEVLCGRPAVDKRFEGEERSLALWAQRCIKAGRLDQIIDPSIKEEISPHCLKVFAEVANKCLHNRPNERPRMSDVVQRLEFALASQDEGAYSSTDTEGEDQGVDGNVSMAVNMPIDSLSEGEEEEEKEQEETEQEEEVVDVRGTNDKQIIDKFPKSDGVEQVTEQPTGSPVSVQESIPDMPKEKAKKKPITKMVQSITKGMDLRRRKTKANDSSSGSSWWWSRSKSTTKPKPTVVSPESSSPAKPSPALPDSLCRSQPTPLIPCRRFSIAEVRAATNNFHRNLVIKYGGPGGEMYRGYIDNGKIQVAIERCTQQSENMFLKEVEMRSQLRHLHMVSFIGYCNDSDETILVYEYLVKGNLSNHLYGTGKDPLPWKKRLEICIGVAQALQYLHTNSKEPMIHGDLKSTSILLNEKWVSKLSGLKVSDLDLDNITRTIVTTVVKKTLGYMDPEYLMCGRLTTRSDVYSFGVVLLEVLCGREPLCHHLNKDQKNLVHWFKSCIQKKTIERVIDPYLIGEIVPKSLRAFVSISELCLLYRGVERPSMDSVVQNLQRALQLQERAGDQFELGAPGDPPEEIRAAAIRAYRKVL